MAENNSEILTDEHLKILNNLLKDLKYGRVEIIIQDGKIIQIEKKEKLRIKN